MLIPFPIRIPVFRALLFTSLLVLVQLLEKTDPVYSLLTFCFFTLSVFAFNTAGGFSRPSGAYIFFFSLLVVDVGTVYKCILGQPADSNLQKPLLMMGTYVGSMAGMLLAAFLSRRISTTQDGMASILNVRSINFNESATGCLMMFFFITYGGYVLPGGGGAVLRAVSMINPFLPLAIFLSVIGTVRSTRGRHSMSLLGWFAIMYSSITGTMSFSKQGMFMPVVAWMIGAAWARYRLRLIHLILLGAFAIAAQTVLVPIANFGRSDVVTGSATERLGLVEHYFTHIPELRHRARTWEAPQDLDTRMFYYGTPQGLFDRLSMMPNDSVLMSFSDEGHYFGYLPVRYYFENWVPHIIDPHKLEGLSVGGNAYMHEMGGLADADTTTGISFSPTAEAFHIDGWRGVLILAPAIWLLLFVTVDAVCGDIRRQPWGLLLVLGFAHVAPEELLGGAIMAVWLGNIGTTMAIYFCGHVTPILGLLVSGNRGERSARAMAIAPLRPLPADVRAS